MDTATSGGLFSASANRWKCMRVNLSVVGGLDWFYHRGVVSKGNVVGRLLFCRHVWGMSSLGELTLINLYIFILRWVARIWWFHFFIYLYRNECDHFTLMTMWLVDGGSKKIKNFTNTHRSSLFETRSWPAPVLILNNYGFLEVLG